MRDEFPKPVVETLAKRVGKRCSNPSCRKRTSGPHTDDNKALNVGVAAHITAASLEGPRYDAALTQDGRKNIGNGIWLCQSCGKLVDNDETRYTKALLLQWKQDAEQEALKEIESASSSGNLLTLMRSRSIAPSNGALGNLISLLNTGAVQGRTLTKRRADFDNPRWRVSLEALYHEIRELRSLYTELVRSGEIDEEKCTCGFRQHAAHGEIDERKQRIIDLLGAILIEASLPTIRGVFQDH